MSEFELQTSSSFYIKRIFFTSSPIPCCQVFGLYLCKKISHPDILRADQSCHTGLSLIRLGDLLDFGQLFKATINLPKSPTFLGKF